MPSFFSSLCSFSWLGGGSKNDPSRDLVARIVEAHNTLVGLDDLRPGEITNKTLGGLVSLCCESHDSVTIKKVLNHSRIRPILPSLRSISSESECCLESHWNSYIVGQARDSKDALALLKSFPYFQNYIELARMELHALYAVEDILPSRIAFLGSGPLPLTSMCLLRSLRHTGSNGTATAALSIIEGASFLDKGEEASAEDEDEEEEEEEEEEDEDEVKKGYPTVVNIDNDSSALTASSLLCEKLGSWSLGMDFRCADALSAMDLRSYDVVFLAALVGVTQREKEEIVINVARRMRAGALLVVRSAHGLRTVLYPEVDLSSKRIREVLQVETVTHPYGKVVNSVIIARVKGVHSTIAIERGLKPDEHASTLAYKSK